MLELALVQARVGVFVDARRLNQGSCAGELTIYPCGFSFCFGAFGLSRARNGRGETPT